MLASDDADILPVGGASQRIEKSPSKTESIPIDLLRGENQIVAVYADIFLVPPGQTYFVTPANNVNWKVTAIAVKGASFAFRFACYDPQGVMVWTEELRRDDVDLRTEIYLTDSHSIVFDNKAQRDLYGFYSAVDA